MLLAPGHGAGDFNMSNMKIVSIIDHEVSRSRASALNDLNNVASAIAQELMDIEGRLTRLRADVDKLQQQSVPQPAVHPSLSQDERSQIVDEQGGG